MSDDNNLKNSNNENKKSDKEIVADLEKILKEYGLDYDEPKTRSVERKVKSPNSTATAPKERDVFTATRNSIAKKTVPPKTNPDNVRINRPSVAAARTPQPRSDISKTVKINDSNSNSVARQSNQPKSTTQSTRIIYDEKNPKGNDRTTAKNAPADDAANTEKQKEHKFLRSIFPFKGDGAKEVIRKIVMDLSAILVVVCFAIFLNDYVLHQNQVDNQRKIDKIHNVTIDDTAAQWDKIKAKYPNVNFPDGMMIKYAELYAKNQDLVGWLKIDNTNIDTAILQHKEDKITDAPEDFYLRHDLYGQSNKYGNAYLDRYNTGSELDSNNVIYGHNMTDGLMFAQLEKYYTIDGFKDSPIIKYSTLFKDYYFKVYAAIITGGYAEADNGYLFNYTNVFFPSEDNYSKFLSAIDERALYKTGVDINSKDKLLILSTCSYEIKAEQMGRLAVIGRLVRDGENTTVDTSLAVENENPRYPQLWYDEHGIDNPYSDAHNWSVDD